jgi:hypothetical protein
MAALLMVAAICSLLVADLGFVAACSPVRKRATKAGSTPRTDVLPLPAWRCYNATPPISSQPGDATLEHVGRLRMAALGAGALLAPMTLLIGNVAGEPVKVRGAAVGAAVLFL